MKELTIAHMAREAGVNLETVRYYQRKGLMAAPDRPQGGFRKYGTADVARVRFIKSAQKLGFSLDDIGQLLDLDVIAGCCAAREIALQKLVDVRSKIAELQRIGSVLEQLTNRCAVAPGQAPCPLIEALVEEASPR